MDAFSQAFIANVVLPMEGRAATMMRSEGCKPAVFLSNSTKPVVTLSHRYDFQAYLRFFEQ